MKKRDLLFTGALLLGFSLNAFAQEDAPESQMFFFGFEDGMTSFTDSSHPVEVIEKINYYAGDPTSNGWDIVYTKDSVMNLLNGIVPYTRSGEKDVVNIITETPEEEGGISAHQAEFEEMGAKGGNNYLKWQTAGAAGGSDCDDYNANLFIRGLNIEDQTSYRLVFYLKSAAATGTVQAGIFRGQYNSEKPLSLNGDSGNEFLLELKNFTPDTWERHTLMAYYQNDSVANNHMYKAGYWWTDSWKVTVIDEETGEEKTYNQIEQFDTYFVRFSFRSPGSIFYVDDIALYKSTIGGAECNADIIRVDFGYQTNLATLAKADPNGAIKLPGDYFSVTGIDPDQGKDPIEIKVLSAEYHADGYLYMWLDDDCDYYSDIKVNFTNPVDDPTLALKYTGTMFPNSLDKEWVDAGKLVPDFENEFVLPNPNVFATSLEFLPPTVASADPENGSFNLATDLDEIKVTFSKEVYVDIAAKEKTNGVLGQLQGNGIKEFWLPIAYDDDTFTVTFKRQGSAALKGDYTFTVMNMRAGEEESYEKGPDYTMSLSFGPADVAPIIIADVDFSKMAKSEFGSTTIDGFSVNESCTMKIGEFSGLYSKALMYGLYSQNLQNGAPILTYTFQCDQPGEWLVKIGSSGCYKDSWNDGCKMEIAVICGEDTIGYYVEEGTETRPEEGGPVSEIDEIVIPANFAAVGEYKIAIILPNENSYGGGHKGGRVLYYIRVSNDYSSAYEYIDKYNNAYKSAQDMQAKAEEKPIYAGAYLDAFKKYVAANADFISTSPSAYTSKVAEIAAETSAMGDRISIVDKFYTEYKAAQDKQDVYADSTYNALAAFVALAAKVTEYKDLDVTVKNNDELKAITEELTAATKAMTDRCSAMDSYNSRMGAVKTILEEQTAFSFLDEFAACMDVMNKYQDTDIIAVSDEDLKTASEAYKAARDAFNNKVNMGKILNQQVKQLADMAEALEVEFDPAIAADVKERLATLLEDDQDLANLFQIAIKAKIYETIALGEGFEETDMTYFIQNSILYTGNKQRKIADNADPFPGWKILATGGNAYNGQGPNGDGQATDANPIVDCKIGLDWNSSVKMSQTLKNLPAGNYTLHVPASAWGDLNGNTKGSINAIQTVADTTNTATSAFYTNDGNLEFVAYGGDVELLFDLATTSAWAFVEKVELTFNSPLDEFSYDDAAAEAKAALELATVVSDIDVPAAAPKYYNLNGMEIKNAKGIVIKVVDGKAQKILVK